MNRDEFMEKLAGLLTDMPDNERMEAIRYYNDYFDEAGSENEEKVIRELGNPEKVAASIKANLQEHMPEENTETEHGEETSGQAYSYGNPNQGEYTENGYRETWQSKSQSSGWNNTKPGRMTVRGKKGGGKWALLIVLLVFASPVLLGIGGGLLGGILGLLGGLLSLIMACLASAVGLVGGGIAILVKGCIHVAQTPAMGLTGIGGGLIAVSLGLLLLTLFLWFCFQILPRLCRTIVNFISRIFRKGKEAVAQWKR